MPYSQLLSQSQSNDGTCVTEQATVTQYDSNTGPNDMLAAVAGNQSDLMDVQLSDPSMADGVGVGDVIQVWGPIFGSDSYSDQSGNKVVVPVVSATYLTLVSAAPS